jgi:cell wall-associated NlpC family hydrolase
MAIEPLLLNLGIKNPKRQNVGFNYAPQVMGNGQPTPGQNLLEKVDQRKQTGADIYQKGRAETTNRVASDIAGKSALSVPTDEFGLVNQTLTDFRPDFTKQIQSTRQRGQIALETEQAKSNWQMAKLFQDLGQYQMTGNPIAKQSPNGTQMLIGNGADIPGADPNNPGAKAVSLAMQAFTNKTPYVWGGNSLTKGIDCSGLIQQVYKQLGINLPRVTYEQAKFGKPVPLNQLRPGDLVFFNTGKNDPNGIGVNGHVGLYIGNGQMIDARGTKSGILRGNMIVNGSGPTGAIRPY